MLKRLTILITISLFSLCADSSYLSATCSHCQLISGYGFASYPKQLENVVKTITLLPEVKALIQKVGREGFVKINIDHRIEAQACWDSTSRTIILNPYQNRRTGDYISSIIFELHNAASDKNLRNLTSMAIRGMISKESYVEGVEKQEHQNAVNTCALLKKGIHTNHFPKDADWIVFRSFEDHYALQQITGHSGDIARSYDRMNRGRRTPPYYGTISHLRHLNQSEQERYMKYLSLKNDLESADRDEINRAVQELQKEYEQLEQCFLGKSKGDACQDFNQRLRLMEIVFKGNPVFETMIAKSDMFTRPNRGTKPSVS